MREKKLLTLLSIMTSISLALSFFSFIFSYGAYMEVKRIGPYIQIPIAESISSTARFPGATGAFIVASSLIALSLVSLLLVIILLIFVFRK